MAVGKLKVSNLGALAQLAGVSVSTASRALAGNPVIAKRTRDRVTALASAHGFQLNVLARNLRLGRTGAVTVVLPMGHARGQPLSDPFLIALIGALADALTRRGQDLLLSRVEPTGSDWLERLIASGRVDGAIVIGQSNQSAVLDRVAARYPAMMVWGEGGGAAHCTVGTDNRRGGAMAAARLIERGCRRPLFLGDAAAPEMAARFAGAADACRSAGLTLELAPAPLTPCEAHAVAAARLAANDPPDGIVAASDVLAMSALRAAAERGLSVPGELAVVGYDDIALAAHTTPPLTTIRQDVARGAELLVEGLARRIAGETTEPVALEPELVIRASA